MASDQARQAGQTLRVETLAAVLLHKRHSSELSAHAHLGQQGWGLISGAETSRALECRIGSSFMVAFKLGSGLGFSLNFSNALSTNTMIYACGPKPSGDVIRPIWTSRATRSCIAGMV